MRPLIEELRSRLHFRIILPFLLLTLIVAIVGAFIVFRVVAESLQERFNIQLASVTSTANEAIVNQESANLQFLREVVFAQANPAAGAPSVPDATANRDAPGLQRAVEPFFSLGQSRVGVRLDRLIAFDNTGQVLVDLERDLLLVDGIRRNPARNLSDLDLVAQVISSSIDDRGDKFARLVRLDGALYLLTAAPVRNDTAVVGGMIAGIKIENMLEAVRIRAQATAITLYDTNGVLLASTVAGLQGDLPADVYQQFIDNPNPFEQALYYRYPENPDALQAALVPLNIRGVSVGIVAPALSRTSIDTTWANARWPLIITALFLMALIFATGLFVANWITKPISELAATAQAITAGDFARRSTITRSDEIGQMADSFNRMTEHLLELYRQVSAESGQRAAILASISDGIVVMDDSGAITLINRATRQMLKLDTHAAMPAYLSDMPLVEMTDGVPGFGDERAANLFSLGDSVVKISTAPITTSDQQHLGYVGVLQDMTREVAVDRAKNNFIGTISHELRTPLTVIRGNADLLLRGLAGPLSDDQKEFVESVRHQATHMTSLLLNVITIAGLDSGSLITQLGPVDLKRPIEEAIWPVRAAIRNKGLNLTVEIPSDLPQVLADFDHVRMVTQQLLDNAQRYTSKGGIIVRAIPREQHVIIEVEDTGRGIAPSQQASVFERFSRGDGTSEGINSAERGIGLGLAIAKQLVERQGGSIWLRSTVGEGSVFSFTLRYLNDTPSPEQSNSKLASAA